MNAGPYLVGLIVGWNFCSNWDKPAAKWLIAAWWLVALVVPLATLWSVYWFYPPHNIEARWVAALYAGLYKPLFALGISCILMCCSQGYGWFANSVLSWRPFQVLGRLTYCAYLVHFCLQRISVGLLTSPIYLTEYSLIEQCFSDVGQSYVLALVLSLTVELPTSALWKLILSRALQDKTVLPENCNTGTMATPMVAAADYTSHL